MTHHGIYKENVWYWVVIFIAYCRAKFLVDGRLDIHRKITLGKINIGIAWKSGHSVLLKYSQPKPDPVRGIFVIDEFIKWKKNCRVETNNQNWSSGSEYKIISFYKILFIVWINFFCGSKCLVHRILTTIFLKQQIPFERCSKMEIFMNCMSYVLILYLIWAIGDIEFKYNWNLISYEDDEEFGCRHNYPLIKVECAFGVPV